MPVFTTWLKSCLEKSMIFELKYAHLSTRKFRVDQWVANIHLLYMPLVASKNIFGCCYVPPTTLLLSVWTWRRWKNIFIVVVMRDFNICVWQLINQELQLHKSNTLPNRSRMRIEKGCEHFKRWTIWYNTVIVLTLLLMLMWELPPTKSKHIILRFCYLHIPSTNLILTKSIIVFVHSNNTNKKEVSRGFQQ